MNSPIYASLLHRQMTQANFQEVVFSKLKFQLRKPKPLVSTQPIISVTSEGLNGDYFITGTIFNIT